MLKIMNKARKCKAGNAVITEILIRKAYPIKWVKLVKPAA